MKTSKAEVRIVKGPNNSTSVNVDHLYDRNGKTITVGDTVQVGTRFGVVLQVITNFPQQDDPEHDTYALVVQIGDETRRIAADEAERAA